MTVTTTSWAVTCTRQRPSHASRSRISTGGQAHSDATIGELPLDAYGTVPWWPEERRHPTLHTLLVHTIQETARHAGHADIIRESIDGAAGLREGVSNMPAEADAAAWKQHYDKLDQIARSVR